MPNFEITDAMGHAHIVNIWDADELTYLLKETGAELDTLAHERDYEPEFELPEDIAKLRDVLTAARKERRTQRQKRKLRPVTTEQMISLTVAIETLKLVRTKLKHAGCPKTLTKVHSALKSAEGAYRHAERRWEASRPKPAA
jgi:hypothetical protein